MIQVTSSYVTGATQQDGRTPITETHIVEGFSHVYDYLSDGTISPQVVMEERAAFIKATLEEREAARVLAIGVPVALYKIDFLNRFTVSERIAIKSRAATDPITADFMLLMENADLIHMQKAMPGLQYLQSVGILTAQRVTEIGAS